MRRYLRRYKKIQRGDIRRYKRRYKKIQEEI